MDKSLAGIIGAIGAFTVATPSHAVPVHPIDVANVLHADSYADLLEPIPNAVAVQQALDEQRSAETAVPDVMNIQYYHHHHHHHRYYRPRYHHHHHHHHHHRGVRIGPVVIR